MTEQEKFYGTLNFFIKALSFVGFYFIIYLILGAGFKIVSPLISLLITIVLFWYWNKFEKNSKKK